MSTPASQSSKAPGPRVFHDRGNYDVLAKQASQLTCDSFTPESVASFLTAVADAARKVAERTVEGPWRVSTIPSMKNALLAPDPTGTDPYWTLTALTLPSVMRGFMAGEPDNLREMAEMMDYVANAPDSPETLRNGILRTALRWNASMSLRADERLVPVDATAVHEAQADAAEAAAADDSAAGADEPSPDAPGGEPAAQLIDLSLDR